MPFNKPTSFLNWVPDGDPTKVVQPPTVQSASGWTEGEGIPFEYLNWLFYDTDQWIKYLYSQISSEVSVFETITQSRLINGGNWSWSTSTNTFAWSSAFNISVPSIPDADNQAASGSVTLTDGQVAYIQSNIPFSVTGNTNSVTTPNILKNVTEFQSLTTGMTVTGAGIPGSTTVTAIADNGDGTANVTISNNATATANGVVLTFASTGALTVLVANNSALVPGPNTIIIARRTLNRVYVGMNSSQMVLRNGEAKPLNENGYVVTAAFVAGETLNYGDVVYVSQGNPTDPSRTAGSVYKVDSGGANNAVRNGFVGFIFFGGTVGQTVYVVTNGEIVLTGPLNVGQVYYGDPVTPGAITSTKPATSGQYVVPVGIAMTTTLLSINAANSAANALVSTPQNYPNFFASDETTFTAALASAVSNGGGVICMLNSFTMSSAHTVPSGVDLIGRSGGSIITFASSGALTLSDGVNMTEIWFTTALTSGNMINLPNNYSTVRDCMFTIPAASTGACINVTGNANKMYNNIFSGVEGETATGILYASGIDNTDTDSVFLA